MTMLRNKNLQLYYIYLSILAHAYNIVIHHGVGAPVHEKEVVNGLSATENIYITMLIYKCATSMLSHYQLIDGHA